MNSWVTVGLLNCGGGGGDGIRRPNLFPLLGRGTSSGGGDGIRPPLLGGGMSDANGGRGETLLLPAKGREGGERGDGDISICLLISRAARAFRLLSSS